MRWLLAITLCLVAGCAGDGESKRRPGPPGGGVDPNEVTHDNLSMSPKPAPAPAPDAAPAPPAGGADPLPVPVAPPASGAPDQGKPAPATGEAKMKMTAEHCRELGKKLAQLAVDAGGPQAEADKIGKDFAGKCVKDQGGQTVDRRDYDCIMAAKAIGDIQACKK